MNIYDYTDNYPLECRSCGWKGTKKEADNNSYDQFLDVRCPRVECDAPIMKIPYPTVEETRLAAEAGNEWAKVDNFLNLLAENFNRDWEKTVNLVKTKISGHRKGLPHVAAYEHSIRVGELIRSMDGATPDIVLAALLHDIVEDGGVSLKELKALGYTDEVIRLVDLCSHDVSIEDSDMRWVCMIAKLTKANDPVAWTIKLADIYDNLQESHALEPKRRQFMMQVKAPLMLKLTEKLLGKSMLWSSIKEYIKSRAS